MLPVVHGDIAGRGAVPVHVGCCGRLSIERSGVSLKGLEVRCERGLVQIGVVMQVWIIGEDGDPWYEPKCGLKGADLGGCVDRSVIAVMKVG